MRSKRSHLARIEALRQAIDCLPERTKVAMLEGVEANTIIVGAYTDRDGGVCPMLAAHRHGGRTSLHAFAKAWDRLCSATEPRRATERELHILRSHLETSLAEQVDLGGAIRDHQAVARERRAREARSLGRGWLRRRSEGPAVTAPASEREPQPV